VATRWTLSTLLLLRIAWGATAQGLYLYAIPTTGKLPDRDAGFALVIEVAEPRKLAEVYGGRVTEVGDGHLVLRAGPYPVLEPAAPETWRSSTFLLDADEAVVIALRDEIQSTSGDTPTPEAITAFVHAAITRKTLGRGWDAASVVARTRTGDCSEHAVLTAALARAAGLAARVVVGAVLVDVSGVPVTMGHAWAEIHHRGAWHVADAALAPADQPLVYLPFGLLADEGPGYALSVARLTTNWVRAVEIR
jgi:transglutaminase-like putative cysteine protease